MEIRDNTNTPPIAREDGVIMRNFFENISMDGPHVLMGHATFPPHTVVPFAAHDADEYAYVISGKAKCKTKDGKEIIMGEGAASFIRAGEVHSSYNDGDEPFTVVWLLVKNR
ncbi:MAG: cupin domain-containing protein [Brevinema sp.]